MQTALERQEDRFQTLLARAERGESLSEPERFELANRFVEDSPMGPLQIGRREVGDLLVQMLAIPRGATVLVAALGAPRALLKLDELARLSFIAEDPLTARVLKAVLPWAMVEEGPTTDFMLDDAVDYAIAGLEPNRLLAAAPYEYDHANVDGSIPAAVAAAELAVRSVRTGGMIALVGTRAAFRELGGATVKAWLGRRVRELANVVLPPDLLVLSERLHLAILEKGARGDADPFRAVALGLRPTNIVEAWKRHAARECLSVFDYSRSCPFAERSVGLSRVTRA